MMRAVARDMQRLPTVSDLPSGAHEISNEQGGENAIRSLKGNVEVLKLEGARLWLHGYAELASVSLLGGGPE